MTLLGDLSPEVFLHDYWQKKPLVVRGACPELIGLLEPDDLKELACTEGVEARLIEEHGQTPWQLSHGPFTTKRLNRLPDKSWTLLVQAVDHYLPALQEVLGRFTFLPAWRIDDVMVSLAAPQGSVGPHFDRYDVFLIQGEGTRLWQVGPAVDDSHPRLPHPQLRLLSDMPVEFEATLHPGDLLYLPPGWAHYGIAQDTCLTYSIGFRAPPLLRVLDRLVDVTLATGMDPLYTDVERSRVTHPGRLDDADVARLRRQILALLDDEYRWHTVLGELLSEPKYDDYEPQGVSVDLASLQAWLQSGLHLLRDPASRLLYSDEQGLIRCYVNGELCTSIASEVFKLLADHVSLGAEQLRDLSDTELQGVMLALHHGWYLPPLALE